MILLSILILFVIQIKCLAMNISANGKSPLLKNLSLIRNIENHKSQKILNYNSTRASITPPNSSISSYKVIQTPKINIESDIEAREALVLEYAVNSAHNFIDVSIISIPAVLSRLAGTVAGIISFSVKSAGGVLNVLSEIFVDAASKIDRSNGENKLVKFISNCLSVTIRSLSFLMFATSQILISIGDDIEAFSVIFTYGLRDSFVHLRKVIFFLHRLSIFLLRREVYIYNSTSNNESWYSNSTNSNSTTMVLVPLRKQNSNVINDKRINNLNTSLQTVSLTTWIEPTQRYQYGGFYWKSILKRGVNKVKVEINSYVEVFKNIRFRLIAFVKEKWRMYFNNEWTTNRTVYHNQPISNSSTENVKKNDENYENVFSGENNTSNYNESERDFFSDVQSVSSNFSNENLSKSTNVSWDDQIVDPISSEWSTYPNISSILIHTINAIYMFYYPSNILQIKMDLMLKRAMKFFKRKDSRPEKLSEIPTLRPHLMACLMVLTLILAVILEKNASSNDQIDDVSECSQSVTPATSESKLNEMIEFNRKLKLKKKSIIMIIVDSIRELIKWVIIFIVIMTMYSYISVMDMTLRQRLISTSYIIGERVGYESWVNNTMLSGTNDINGKSIINNQYHGETTEWMNILFKSMWNLRNDRIPKTDMNQGFGVFLESSIESILRRQLAAIPRGFANMQLKKFNIGTEPPVFLNIRTVRRREKTNCLQYIPSKTSEYPYNMTADEAIVDYVSPVQNDFFDELRSAFAKAFYHVNQIESIRSEREIKYDTIEQLNKCVQIVTDIDFNFMSKDMDLTLSYRPEDMKSVLPDGALSVSNIFLKGRLRFHIDLVPDYPFVGNATLSFVSIPQWDITATIGGIDITMIPGLSQLLNSTITWILDQYIYPKYTPLDLKYIFCPSCDEPPHMTAPEVIMEGLKSLFHHIRNITIDGYNYSQTVLYPRIKRKYEEDKKFMSRLINDIIEKERYPIIEHIGADGDVT